MPLLFTLKLLCINTEGQFIGGRWAAVSYVMLFELITGTLFSDKLLTGQDFDWATQCASSVRMCVYVSVFFPRVTNGLSSTAPVACCLTERPVFVVRVCVWQGCTTHVQVCWDVCRVHGLSLRSSVTIPRLSFPLLWTEWTKWNFLRLLFVICPSLLREDSISLSYVFCINELQLLLGSPCLYPAVSPLFSLSSCCQCQISQLLSSFPCLPDLYK